ncbi:acid-sensing ion channel 4-A-like [Saccoglossus kowalevskii]|uniref:Acid-sensing ion channel 4-like n=1 Tax=Saccoglossus kowalevskii TaxID=10224 RepID=A0ABM0MEL3_SACKO|nr:PREDICTED: acid-sensing ion channel 4-like [Saccoglossus kowalevskii]
MDASNSSRNIMETVFQTTNDVHPSSDEDMSHQRNCAPRCRDRLREFTQETTLHGIRFTTDSKSNIYRRLMWVLFVSLGTAGVVITLKDSAIRFIAQPVTTVVEIHHPNAVPFPAVTVCNYNKYRQSVLAGTWAEDLLYKMYGSPVQGEIGEVDWSNYTDVITNLNRTAFEMEAAHQIEDMLIACTWSSETACGPENFTNVMTNYGVCYTFNGDVKNGLTVKNRGSMFGLYMVLDIEQHEYMPGVSKGAGVKIMTHTQTDVPLVNEVSMSFGPGMDSTIALRLHQTKLLRCTNQPLQYFDVYSRANCEMESFTLAATKSCTCREPYMPEESELSCESACQEVIYDSTISYGSYPSLQILKKIQLMRNITEAEIRENYLAISVFIEDLTVLSTEEEYSYTYDAFLGDIGGQFGLCLGASLLTLLEFFDFLMMSLCGACRRWYNRSRKQ